MTFEEMSEALAVLVTQLEDFEADEDSKQVNGTVDGSRVSFSARTMEEQGHPEEWIIILTAGNKNNRNFTLSEVMAGYLVEKNENRDPNDSRGLLGIHANDSMTEASFTCVMSFPKLAASSLFDEFRHYIQTAAKEDQIYYDWLRVNRLPS